MSAQEQIALKRQQMAQRQKEASELGAMLAEMKKMQLASLMGQSKPSVVLTDQTDLGDKIKELTTKLTEAVKSTDTTDLDKDQIKSLNKLESNLEKIASILSDASYDDKSGNASLLKAIKAIDLKPIINLPAPVVNVEPQKVDFTPLQDTFREYMDRERSEIDLDCYRAQDLSEKGDIQYVGFVNPEGNWYIIENNVSNNTMRYVFGTEGYAKAFARASTFDYRLLNEALS